MKYEMVVQSENQKMIVDISVQYFSNKEYFFNIYFIYSYTRNNNVKKIKYSSFAYCKIFLAISFEAEYILKNSELFQFLISKTNIF